MTDWLTSALLLVGATFMLLAAIGVLRMPDVITRMQATTKATSLGVLGIFLAVTIHFGAIGIGTRALLGIAFVFLTAPTAAHMISRAAYFAGVPLWHGTVIDELRERFPGRRPAGPSDALTPPDRPPEEGPRS